MPRQGDLEHRILALLYEQDATELTPTYVAYALRISPKQANELLDEMVKNSMLELEHDDEGNLYYQLPASEETRLSRQIAAAAGDGEAAPETDGSVVAAPEASSARPQPSGTVRADASHASPPQPREYRPTFEEERGGASRESYPSGPNGVDGSVEGASVTAQDRTRERSGGRRRPARKPKSERRGRRVATRESERGRSEVAESISGRPEHHPMVRTDHQHAAEHEGGVCRHCGQSLQRRDDHQQQLQRRRRNSSPGLAAVLSMLIPGAGQMYNRQAGKGIVMFFAWLALLSFFMGWAVRVWAGVDAYRVAKS